MENKKAPSSHWNHRVLVEKSKGDELYFYIAEVFYEFGEPILSTNAIDVNGESIKDLKWTLDMMKKALSKPILWGGDDFPKVYEAK